MSVSNDILPYAGDAPAPEDKPGYATTEFWITLLTVAASLVTAVKPTLASKVGADQVRQWAAIAAGVASVGYAIARALTKHGAAQVRAATVAARAAVAVAPPAIPVEVDEPADAAVRPRGRSRRT